MTESQINSAKEFLDTISVRTESVVLIRVDGEGVVHLQTSGSVEKLSLSLVMFQNYLSETLSGRIKHDQLPILKESNP